MIDRSTLATEILHSSQGYNCVIINEDLDILKSEKSGLYPLLEYINDYTCESEVIMAIHIMGKAEAFLVAMCNAKYVYADLISNAALTLLKSYGIITQYEKRIPFIKDSSGHRINPLEESLLHINDPNKAIDIIIESVDKIERAKNTKSKAVPKSNRSELKKGIRKLKDEIEFISDYDEYKKNPSRLRKIQPIKPGKFRQYNRRDFD